jgi:hypothetical protein
MPVAEEVQAVLEAHPHQGSDSVLLDRIEVMMETPRGRALEVQEVFIVDLPWYYLTLFRKCPSRAAGGRQILFHSGATICRPVLTGALETTQQWIADTLDGETAQEYTDAREEESDAVEAEPSTPIAASQQGAGEIQSLRARLTQLEAMLLARDPAGGGTAPAPPAKTSLLGGGKATPTELTQGEMASLHKLVGAAPKRIARAETLAKFAADPTAEETAFAEREREVRDALEPSPMQTIMDEISQTGDPLQKMLILQMKQTNDLMRALAPRSSPDPLSAILSAPDNVPGASSSSSINVKGYAAREAFIKQVEDDKAVVGIIRSNARQELGISEAKEEPSLLRSYLENRIPVGDHKTFAQVGYILAWGWEKAAEQGNLQMMAFCGRMMMYVEQACLDGGRTNLAWLMTALAEPNYQHLAAHRRRATLSPFSRLAAPVWMAANLSYLKDIDTFETRLKQLGTGKAPAAPGTDSVDPPPKAKARPKKQKGGKGAPSADDPPQA